MRLTPEEARELAALLDLPALLQPVDRLASENGLLGPFRLGLLAEQESFLTGAGVPGYVMSGAGDTGRSVDVMLHRNTPKARRVLWAAETVVFVESVQLAERLVRRGRGSTKVA